MAFYGLVPRLVEPLERLGGWTADAISAVEAWLDDGDSSALVAALDQAAAGTLGATESINREMERYVLDLQEPMRLHGPAVFVVLALDAVLIGYLVLRLAGLI